MNGLSWFTSLLIMPSVLTQLSLRKGLTTVDDVTLTTIKVIPYIHGNSKPHLGILLIHNLSSVSRLCRATFTPYIQTK